MRLRGDRLLNNNDDKPQNLEIVQILIEKKDDSMQ